jgi:hypothetical protein
MAKPQQILGLIITTFMFCMSHSAWAVEIKNDCGALAESAYQADLDFVFQNLTTPEVPGYYQAAYRLRYDPSLKLSNALYQQTQLIAQETKTGPLIQLIDILRFRTNRPDIDALAKIQNSLQLSPLVKVFLERAIEYQFNYAFSRSGQNLTHQ